MYVITVKFLLSNFLLGTFCKDVYYTIRSMEFGSIIWTYLKPIMRGKILYTPDNEITRAILAKVTLRIHEIYRL